MSANLGAPQQRFSERGRRRSLPGPRVRRAHPRRRNRSASVAPTLAKVGVFDNKDRLTDEDFSAHAYQGTPEPEDRGLNIVDQIPTPLPGAGLLARKRSAALIHEARTGTPVPLPEFVDVVGAFVAAPRHTQQPLLVSMPDGPLKSALAAVHDRVVAGSVPQISELYDEYVVASGGTRGKQAAVAHTSLVAQWCRVARGFRDIGKRGRKRVLAGTRDDVLRFFRRMKATLDEPEKPSVCVAKRFLELVDEKADDLPSGGRRLSAFVGRLVHDAMTAEVADEMAVTVEAAEQDHDGVLARPDGAFFELLAYLRNANETTRKTVFAHANKNGFAVLTEALNAALAAGPAEEAIDAGDAPRFDALAFLLSTTRNSDPSSGGG